MATAPTSRAKAATRAAASVAAAPAAAPVAPAAAPAAVAPAAAAVEAPVAKTAAKPTVSKEHVESVDQAKTAALKSYEDAVSLSKDAVEAWVQAGTVFSRGLQDISHKIMGVAQNVVETNVTASKQMLSAKTIRDVVDMHSTLSRENFDRLMAEGSHLSDLTMKLVEEALAPLNQKVNTLMERLVKKP